MKRTDSFEVEGQGSGSNQNIAAPNEFKTIKKEDVVISKKMSQMDGNEPSSFYRRKEKIPHALRTSILQNASGKKPSMKVSKIGQMFKEKIMETFLCGICECEYNVKEFTKITKC